MEKAKLCAKCGKCLSVCPVYSATKRETFSPRGRVTLLQARLLAHEALAACLLCGACEALCPNQIPLTKLIFEARLRHTSPWARGIPLLQVLGAKLRPRFAEEASLPDEGDVALFLGCGADFLYPEATKSLVSLLRQKEIKLALPKGQGCCGLPALSLGDKTLFLEYARKNLEALAQAESIITLCASCLYTFAELYPYFLENTPLGPLAREIATKIFEAGEFLFTRLDLSPQLSTPALFQVPCHLRNLKRPKWWHKVNIFAYEGCCGAGGTFGLRFKKESSQIVRPLSKVLEKSFLPLIITSCTACWWSLKRRYPRLIVQMLPQALSAGAN